MFRRAIPTLAVVAAVSAAWAADYMFPSPNPPANLKPSEVDQYICFIWDDNAYSGLNGTPYEPGPNTAWANMCRVGGVKFESWGTTPLNTLNINEGDMGMSWACDNLLKNASNKDGSQPTMTFNVITGQVHPIFGSWSEAGGTQFGYKGKQFTTVNWSNPSQTLLAPVCWGREYANYVGGWGTYSEELALKYKDAMPEASWNNPDYDKIAQPNWTSVMYNRTKQKGHELGNHTIDHMETNSGLPKEMWPNGGEGFDPGVDKDVTFSGEPVKEQYAAWDVIGWEADAGRKISQKAWGDAIDIGEEMLDKFCDVSIAKGNLYSFRAPRLEINSNCLHALKEKGYTYDCGLEEGYEENMDGSNALWPYTFDNGSPNIWIQKANGEKVAMNSFPTGLWEVPVNVMIVPEDIRDQVWARHNEIALAANEGAPEPLADWKKHGKITGFDFNMFILWGMTKADFVKTMKYNLDLRLNGNKSPMQFGCHTDYYTPMYDNATLMNEVNKASYGLNITNNWNTFKDRIAALQEFVTYANSKGVNFVSGIKLIENLRKLQAKDVVGTAYDGGALPWEFFDGGSTASSDKPKCTGSIANAKITVPAQEGVDCGYAVYFGKGAMNKLDHISLTYKTTAPLLVRLVVDGDDYGWEVLLNNIGPEVNSGNIPVSAFHRNQYFTGTVGTLNPADIVGIEIAVLTPGTAQETVTLDVKNLKVYGPSANPFTTAVIGGPVAGARSAFGITAFSSSMLKLTVGDAGRYSVGIFSANGRAIRTFDNVQLQTGLNSLNLNSLPQGMYMIRLQGVGVNATQKALIM